ncbi:MULTISPECIES: helix-turn-helix transcriptional regulator [unclassified Paenibacillus]|uniref:helix-turn-helix domain-containing protein n=1 Tax=unclassified Paenibacillus TaxID=185978 RepID=UPI001AE46B92|nr:MULTISPECIES: helix-turn-helix transcriptional regulator [unclassified Paenibacillus]MBP1155206.1 transcriptional regulator with XRE-family HTH domain [Paenibacillus sp. PvP091]MBP1169410.1 transcriptional regulator with XRE-family HTH domain [Paenibacillus sp. PvR098]MBP2440438.1 transcriptional regulator with XRE-family HTH domain [Paenibacillus sp. PvP052]
MKLEEAYGKLLKEYRQKKNLSQEQLAFESGLDRTYISMLERGKRQPSLSTIFSIAKSLNIKPSEFLEKLEE